VVTIGFAVAGFWWFEGATTTKREYWEGTAKFRPWNYFLIANLGAAMFALGPTAIFGLKLVIRHPRVNAKTLSVVGGGVLALVAAHLSQYSKAEVERIWLPFYPWILVAGAVFMAKRSRWAPSVAVFAQAAGAVALQSYLLTKW
jgi:methylthioxylose transferase